MKKILRNKKILISIIVGFVLLLGIILGVILLHKDEGENKKLKENTYTMYVKINPLVKLTFKESYYTCNNKKCSDYKTKVINAKFLNDDAKEIYKDIDLKDKDVLKSINLLIETYLGGLDKQLEKITITTDWKNYKDSKLQQELEKIVTEVVINYNKEINESDILESEIKKFTITFDSDGGENVENQVIEENQKVTQPNEIKKDGYTFVEWQLNGEKYDFDNEVKEDITLKAIWKKIEEKKDNNITNTSTPVENENTSQPNNEIDSSNNINNEENNDPEKGCYTTPEKDVPLAYKFSCGMEGKEAYEEMLKLKAGELKEKLNKVNDGSGHAQQLNAGYNLVGAKYNYKYSVGIVIDIILIDPVDKVSSFGYLKEDGTVEWVYFREAR